MPARYAEGYYLSADASAPGTVTLTGKDAHAWAEVYFDGVGWLPLDTTPSHYFEAAGPGAAGGGGRTLARCAHPPRGACLPPCRPHAPRRDDRASAVCPAAGRRDRLDLGV
ncbi:MAG: transglutaminase family protein [Eubacteriales bacterium]|nr:transglutaminase family protein [Eubacteriales bacterium]